MHVDLTERGSWLQRFHDTTPSTTPLAYARSGSYERLAAVVRDDARVLDLACGDGHLAAILASRRAAPPRADVVGVDFSITELRAACARELPGTRFVVGRAQALPIADASIDIAVCHLAFMLFDDLERVVAELGRVLAPGGSFHAVLGGGPTAEGDDVFHRFLRLAAPALQAAPRFGDQRARSEAGWRELFRDGWSAPTFVRHELDLSGSADEVWQFLTSSYEREWLAGIDIASLRAALFDAGTETTDSVEPLVSSTARRLPCRVVTWLGSVRRT